MSITQNRRLLIASAHPDDAEIAAGGTIARCVNEGWDVRLAIFTNTETDPRLADSMRQAVIESAGILGHGVEWVGSGHASRVEDIRENDVVRMLDGLIERHRPDTVISHWCGDSHVDHARLARAALAAMRRTAASLYAMPPSEFRSPAYDLFPADLFVDVSAFMGQKLSALGLYRYEGWHFQPIEPMTLAEIAGSAGRRLRWSAAEQFAIVRQVGFPLPLAPGPPAP